MKYLFKWIVSALVVIGTVSQISDTNALELRHKFGYLMARGLVFDGGAPVYSEYDEVGELVRDIGPASGDLDESYVMSGYGYHSLVEFYKKFSQENEDGLARGAYILDAETYKDRQFVTLNGEAITDDAKSDLLPGIKSVLVKSNELLLIPDNDPMLIQVPINLSDIQDIDPETIKSVLLTKDGNVHTKSEHNIGFKVAYFEGELDGEVKPENHSKIYAPIKTTAVQITAGSLDGGGVSDERGKYSGIYFIPPCPGFAIDSQHLSSVRFHYTSYNPRAGDSVVRFYHLLKKGYDFCVGYGQGPASGGLSAQMAQINALGIVATLATPINQQDFKMDTAVISGKGFFSNDLKEIGSDEVDPIPVGATEYEYEVDDDFEEPITQTKYDFDGDEELEEAVLGQVEPKEVDGETVDWFTKEGRKDVQGIFLSSGSQDSSAGVDDPKSQPDFVRLADKADDLKDQGLLKTLSESDMQETDIYVFRESNGQLILKREGLKEDDLSVKQEGGLTEESGEFYYGLMLRGPDSAAFDSIQIFDKGENYYSSWQSEAKIDPSLHEREADHIRAYEKVKVVAINRKTGYIGTLVTEIGKSENTGQSIISDLNPDKIVMRPPNLKIIAERMYKVQSGLTKDEEKEYLIGYEGAALTSDVWVKITTEWFDNDGSPLPEELEEEGYTARLAKISGENELSPQGGEFAEFSVKPGRHTENIQITGEGTLSEHFYVQVSGEQKSESPNFSSSGAAGEAPLQYRPDHYVPFKVAVSDETLTWEQFTEYKKYKRENPGAEIEKPKPIYRWFYRPEMQFSLMALEVKNIFREFSEEDGNTITVNVHEHNIPVISDTDDLVRIAYSLLEKAFAPLEFINHGQQLVFALGEHEIEVEFGNDKQLNFKNIEHLSNLDIEDFLTLRLYDNHDPGNILWEFAFAKLLPFPSHSEEEPIIYISADDADAVDFTATIVNKIEDSVTINWGYESEQNVTFSPSSSTNTDGLFQTVARFPTKADTEVSIHATHGEDANNKFPFTNFKIYPGKPADVEIEQSGKTAIEEIGGITIKVTAKDEFENFVEDGTPIHVTSTDLVVEGDMVTVDGIATFELRGGFQSGIQEVEIKVGEYTEIISVMVHNVDLSISIPNTVEVDSHIPISVTAQSSYGDLSGSPIRIKATRAAIDGHIFYLDSSNSVNLNAYVGRFSGEGNVLASIADKYTREDFEVVDSSGITVLDNVIISGATSDGSFNVDGADFEYTGSTAVVVNGAPGQTFNASFMNFEEPPLLPELKYTFQEAARNNQVFDEMQDVPALVGGALRIKSRYKQNSYSFSFNATDRVQVEHQPLKDIESPGVVFNLKVNQLSGNDSEIIQFANTNLKLVVDAQGRLKLIQTDGSSTVSVLSESVSLSSWMKVGVHRVEGKLVLSVNGTAYESTEPLPFVDNDNHFLIIGDGFTGEISELSVYDWGGERLITFEDGTLTKSLTLDASGVGYFSVTAAYSNAFASLQQRKFEKLKEQYGENYFEFAFAAGDDCTPVDMSAVDSFGEALDAGAAMAGHVADCEYLPKIKEAFLTIKSDAGTWTKSIAIAELGAYTSLYISAKVTELALIMGPECANGAVTGKVTGFVSGLCDIITSFFLIGDLRDYGIHSWHYYIGDESKFKYDIYIFSGLGIAASLATLAGGIGAPVNAGLAGAKTAAKLFSGSFTKGLARYLSRTVGENWSNLDRLMPMLRVTLPILQLTAAAIVLKDIVPKVLDSVKNIKPHQIEAVMHYFKKALENLEQDLTIAQASPAERQLYLEIAYAAISPDTILSFLTGSERGGRVLKELLIRMERAQDSANDVLKVRPGNTAISRMFNDGIAKLKLHKNDISNEALAKIISEDKFLSSLILIQEMAIKSNKSADEFIDAIRRFHCVPPGCFMGGVASSQAGMKQFFDFFGTFSNLHKTGKVTDDAWESALKTIKGFGQQNSGGKNSAIINYRNAKGDTANFAEAVQKASESGVVLIAFEKKVELPSGNYIADHVVRIGDKEIFREVKDWKPDNIVDFMMMSLKGEKVPGDKTAGQFNKILSSLFKDGAHTDPSKVNFQWVFTNGNIDNIVDGIVDKIKKNPDSLKSAIKASGNSNMKRDYIEGDNSASKLDDFIEEGFADLLVELFKSAKKVD